MKKYFRPTLLTLSIAISFAMAEDPVIEAKIDESTQPAEKKSFFTPNFTYWDVSYNYLAWSEGSRERSIFTDFVYLELEGGAGWDWGEFYFFADMENPTHSWDNEPTDERRFVIKPILDIKLGDTNWYFHLQDYHLYSRTFYVNNLVPGIAYKYQIGDFWIRPFIGPHIQSSTFYDGYNGWMTGWVFMYSFKIGEEKFALTNWHEFELDRAKEHYLSDEGTPIGDGNDWGINGALALWWTPVKEITAGVQYRYALYKLGVASNVNAVIWSLKYNF